MFFKNKPHLRKAISVAVFVMTLLVLFIAFLQLGIKKVDIPEGYVPEPFSEAIPVDVLYELDLAVKEPGSVEAVEIVSEIPDNAEGVFLLRYYVVGGQVVSFESPHLTFAACDSGELYETNRVCVDIASTEPFKYQELLARITIKWHESIPGSIWVEQGGGFFDGDKIVTNDERQEPIPSLPATGDEVITGDVRPDNWAWLTDEGRILLSAIAIVLMIGVTLISEKIVKAKSASQIFKAIVLINAVFLIISMGVYIQTHLFVPDDAKAAAPTVEKSQLVQPVLRVAITLNYGNCPLCHSYCYGPSGLCHSGIDLGNAQNVLAAGAGVVHSISYSGSGYGNRVVIKHTNSAGRAFYTTYNHLQSIRVSRGQTVDYNTVVGYMGATGNATGVHLHFELCNNLNYVASAFEDPTAIVRRTRGSVNITPPVLLKCGETGCANDGRSGKNADAACEGWIDSSTTEYECKELSNRCERIRCPDGATVTPPCTCPTTATGTPTITPTGSLTPTPSTTISITPTLSITPTKSISPTPTPKTGGIVCGPLDINGDNIINYVDLKNFSSKYQKVCSDSFGTSGCGGVDFNNDKIVDYQDLYNFTINYYPKVLNCSVS